jgi:hypothetical protein
MSSNPNFNNFGLSGNKGIGLPSQAIQDLTAFQPRIIGDGVARYSGHDGYGLAIRFFIFPKYNKAKSKAAGCELFDPIEMLETFIDRKTRCAEMVTDKIRHKFPDEYKRFQEGREAPGTPLDRWGVIPSHEVLTFAKDGIFTVEQLAIQDTDRIRHRYPASFFEYFTRAQQAMAAKSGLVEVEKNAAAMVELQRAYAALEAKVILLQRENSAPKGKKAAKVVAAPVKGKRGRPRKVGNVEIPDELTNIEEDNEQ